MAIVIKPITVEVSKPNVFQAIAAKQNDSNSRFLNVTFVNEGEKIHVLPTSTVTINAKRNDGETDSFLGEANNDGTATFPIHSWMLELAGYVNCDVSIINSAEESKLTSTSFTILVEEASHNSDDISSDEQYDVLTELIKNTQGLEDEMIAYTDSKTKALEKRIVNLEQGITPSPFVTDDAMAYTKNVPENTLPYAEVTKIGGMTYKEGDTLKSAPVTEVESVGANVFGGDVLADKLVNDCNAVKNESVGTVTYSAGDVHKKALFEDFKPNTRYTIILKGNNASDTQSANVAILYTDGTYETNQFLFTNGTIVAHSAAGKSIEAFCGYWNTSTSTLYYKECGVFEGVLNESDFSPYIRNTLPIPAEVQAIDGYGEGVNDTCYNYVDWEKKQFVKRVGKIDLGSLNWSYSSVFGTGVKCFYSKDDVDAKYGSASIPSNVLCAMYETITPNAMSSGVNGICTFDTLNAIIINDQTYTDTTTFKSAMSGVMLYYELAEPVITDISDILPEDNFIGVEGNGTITLKNEYAYDVPSEITYQIKEVAE